MTIPTIATCQRNKKSLNISFWMAGVNQCLGRAIHGPMRVLAESLDELAGPSVHTEQGKEVWANAQKDESIHTSPEIHMDQWLSNLWRAGTTPILKKNAPRIWAEILASNQFRESLHCSENAAEFRELLREWPFHSESLFFQIVQARSLQCGFWPRNSQILI